MTSEPGVVRGPIYTTRFRRAEVRRALRAMALTCGVELALNEDYGILDGVTTFSVSGRWESVQRFAEHVNEWVDANA